MPRVTPELLLRAYSVGVFPMAESADDPALYWHEPLHRGVLPLDSFHVGSRLARTVRQDRFEVRIDSDFEDVIAGCGARAATWINLRIVALYKGLFDMGYCHTVEVWREGALAGGLYGVHLKGAFFGESMFSRERDASKVALVHLAARLKAGRFRLLDTQFITEHLRQFGAIEVPRDRFQELLANALEIEADFGALPKSVTGAQALDALKAV
jgi:leucyl/phenylalanyl-tRNA--protein transferase